MQESDITCANCGEGTLRVATIPGTTVSKRGFNGGMSDQFSPGRTEFLTKKCPKCGALRGERQIDRDRRLEQLRALGIGRIVTVHRGTAA